MLVKCPACDETITRVNVEVKEAFSGRGTPTYVFVASSCNHAIGAVPVLWEKKLNELLQIMKKAR